jgi:hypothetical protein
MSSKDIHPKWWQLYLVFPLLMALFAIDNRLRVSTRTHQVVQIGIVLIVFGLVHVWLKANSVALSRMDQVQYRGTVRVIRIPPSQLSETDKQPMLQLPDSEIKGVLSDTFEMNYIDAESCPVEEIPQESNKE